MPSLPRALRHVTLALSGLALGLIAGTAETEDAVANGDTRSLSIYHTHTQESATITFRRDGRYDRAALEQLNWLLRDWRVNEPTKMDPRLFDTVWEAYRQVGATQPIHVVSAYRSPGTNAMLRRRSRMVAEYSQHMLGKAMDFFLPDVSIDRIREVGLRMQRGGVGWYPHAGTPFVHLDVGSVRMWPRMTHDQLARLFPDGKTDLLPSDNRPFPRYEEAKAEILARGGTVAGLTTQMASGEEEDGPGLFGFLASLFGGGRSAPEPAPAPAPVETARKSRRAPVVAVASADPQDPAGARAALAYAAPAADDALRGSLAERAQAKGAETKPSDTRPADAKALLTASQPVAVDDTVTAVTAPLPPRRPADMAAVAASLNMPLPPPRPVQFAALERGMANLAPAAEIRALDKPAAAVPARARSLVAPDADAKAQLRALFDSVSAGPGAAPASRATPVHVAATRLRGAAPDAVVGAAPDRVTTRFSPRSPGDDLPTRFTGSAARAVSGAR